MSKIIQTTLKTWTEFYSGLSEEDRRDLNRMARMISGRVRRIGTRKALQLLQGKGGTMAAKKKVVKKSVKAKAKAKAKKAK